MACSTGQHSSRVIVFLWTTKKAHHLASFLTLGHFCIERPVYKNTILYGAYLSIKLFLNFSDKYQHKNLSHRAYLKA